MATLVGNVKSPSIIILGVILPSSGDILARVHSVHIDEFLGLKEKKEPKQNSGSVTPFNPAKPEGPKKCNPRRPRTRLSRIRLKRGEALDTYTAELIGWVAGGCQASTWSSLLTRKDEPEAPSWLKPEALGLEDDLSHRVLALALAHLIHLQGGLESSPFEVGGGLDGGHLLRLLSLPLPFGVWELAKCLAADAPLRSRGFLEVQGDWSSRRKRHGGDSISVTRFLQTELSLSMGSLGFLLGLEKLQEEDPLPSLESLALPGAVRAKLERLLQNPPPLDHPFKIFLKGSDQSGRRTLASWLARHFNRVLKPIRPSEGHQPGSFILVELPCHFDFDDWNQVKAHPGWIFLKPLQKDMTFDPESRTDLVLDLGPLTTEDRTKLWSRQLQEAGPTFAMMNASDLALIDASPGRIVEAVGRVARSSAWEEFNQESALEALKGALSQDKSEDSEATYTEKLNPERSLDEFCLPAEAMDRFKRIIQAIRGRKEMLANWKLDPGLVGRAQGIALFHGPSGTGKSMAAEVLSHELGMPLWRMEAAELESPFVGESEQRLHDFFSSVKDKPAVLLLDEADTVLMDRGKTTGSTQRYQNNLVNTWLRELDRFQGVLVFTTNHAEGLDPAIERRIQFRMAFESPSAEVRAQIWKALLGKAPIPGRETLDFYAVAEQFSFSGGRIRNAFLGACQRAAEVGAISQGALIAACKEELQSSITSHETRKIHGFGA